MKKLDNLIALEIFNVSLESGEISDKDTKNIKSLSSLIAQELREKVEELDIVDCKIQSSSIYAEALIKRSDCLKAIEEFCK